MALTLISLIEPHRGYRAIDAWGGGGYGAPRRKDGKSYPHKGLDFIAECGDKVVAPMDCEVAKVGVAYANTDLGSIHLHSPEMRLKVLYVKPQIDCIAGAIFKVGDWIGSAQSVAGYHMAHEPHKGPMINHVHLEVQVLEGGVWKLVNPALYLPH